MRRLLWTAVLSSAILALSGCGGGTSDNAGDEGGANFPQSFSSIDVIYLQDGFIIDGHNRAGEAVTLEYCRDSYDYYSGPGHWYGHFNINGDRINMFDDTPTGGSYRIDTYNNFLEVGVEYPIDFQNDEIIVEQITEDLSC